VRHAGSPLSCIAVHPEEKFIATGSHGDGTIRFGHIDTLRELKTIRIPSGAQLWALKFSPDGKTLASGGMDRLVQIWDTTTWQVRQTCTGHTAEVNCVAFAPDGRTLASGAWDHNVCLWDAEMGGQPVAKLAAHSQMVRDVAFSADGKTLLSSGKDGIICVWDVEKRALRRTLDGHQKNLVRSLSLTRDGRLLASASRDGTLNLWDFSAGTVRATLQEGTLSFQVLAFSPDGKTLAVGGIDRNVTRLDVAKLGAGAGKQP